MSAPPTPPDSEESKGKRLSDLVAPKNIAKRAHSIAGRVNEQSR